MAFDLDGTLVDSRKDIADSANQLLMACGAQPLDEAAIGRMVGDGAATLVARAFRAANLTPPPDALVRFLGYYSSRLTAHTRPYPGIPEALRLLGRRCTLAVLTNKPLAPTRAILEALGLMPHFHTDLIIGGDGPYPRKPDPSGLHALAAAVNTTAERVCLVGDSAIDLTTARAAGAACCLVRYGFGFEGVREDELQGETVIDSPEQLAMAVLGGENSNR